jgi:hypothetical protein
MARYASLGKDSGRAPESSAGTLKVLPHQSGRPLTRRNVERISACQILALAAPSSSRVPRDSRAGRSPGSGGRQFGLLGVH